MFGKVANLEKPMILLKKIKKQVEKIKVTDEDEEASSQSSEDMDEDMSEVKYTTEYVIEAIIRKRLLFNKRPRPIVSLETKIKF